MPQGTAPEREKKRRNRSAEAIAKLDAAESGGAKKKPPAKPVKKPAKEATSVGRDDSNANADRLGKQMREAIAREKAKGNLKKVEDLKSRLKQLEATRTQ